MPNKTLYFNDPSIWEQAQRIAHLRGESLSKIIQEFLAEYVERNAATAAKIEKLLLKGRESA